jgi:hypothetical protein
LDQIKTAFDTASQSTKRHLLNQLKRANFRTAPELEQYHDLLCFLRAYSDSTGQLATVERQLIEFAGRIEKYKRETADEDATELADSGIVGTASSHTFSYDLTRAASHWYPQVVDIDWDEYNRSESANLLSFLPLIVAWQENDAIDNDPDYDVQAWLHSAASRRYPTTLAVLLHLLETSSYDHATRRSLFENAQIPVKWTLTNSPASRTLKRLPAKALFFQHEPLRGRTRDLRADLKKPARSLTRLSRSEGERYVRAIKEVLGVRVRELFPLIGANPAEVYRYMPGRGIEIIVYGNNPDIRLPLESNFGAMLLRNGMPIGYGVSAVLFDRAEIAINVFPSFRSGESSFVIESFFHLFVAHFGARTLLVKSYQVGDDNDEAIESGSFWFYYKLGFRPVRPKVRKLADLEASKLARKKGYRTPEKVLRRLAKSDVVFHLDPIKADSYTELSLPNLAYAVGNYIRDTFDSDRQLAVRESVKRVVGVLNLGNLSRWSPTEKIALERMAPLICCIPDLSKWSVADKTLLGRIVKAKGGRNDREYVQLTLRHRRLQLAMHYLAEITRPPE